jgi:glucokinase
MYTIGLDLGGTKIAAALVDESGTVMKATEIPTEAVEGPDAVIRRMEYLARELANHVPSRELQGVGVAAPGPLNVRTGIVYGPPNLPGWDAIPLQAELQDRLGLPTILDNDGNAAALAEMELGAGVGVRDMIYITISTGIGGGVVLDGQIRRGSSGSAAEIGHQVIDVNGPVCPCGNRGCLETLASGTAIRKVARERIGQDMDARAVAQLAVEGNLIAKGLLDEVYGYLGVGLVNVVQMFDPTVIVIGGGVAQIGKPLFDRLQFAVDTNSFRSPSLPSVKVLPAKLGTRAGVIGAALLPRSRFASMMAGTR